MLRRRDGGALSRARLLGGFALAVVGGPALTWGMGPAGDGGALVVHALAYQLLVIAVALVGGWWPALLTAVLSGLSLDYFFMDPRGAVSVALPLHVVALVLYIVNGLLVSTVVDQAARRARAVRRSAAEAARLHEAELEARVAARGAEEADRVRTALLNALGHDLRRPLAAAVAAVGALRSPHFTLSDADRRELLLTADEALATQTDLVTNLLDVSRLEAGAIAVNAVRVRPAEVALEALAELGLGPAQVALAWPEADLEAVADPGLLKRVLVNLLANAVRFQPDGSPVRLSLEGTPTEVRLSVADTGPGLEPDRRDGLFQPFQRLGDTDNTTGLGLGLAVAKGFVEGMNGRIEAMDTPGGGLTMVLTLPAAPANDGDDARTEGETP